MGIPDEPHIEGGELIDFGKRKAAVHVIKIRHEESGQEMLVQVHDKYPQMGDVHVEGRRFVEASVEHYIELVALAGWKPVDPREGKEEQAHE